MWDLQAGLFSSLILQIGGLCLGFSQPASSRVECEPAESCIGYEEQSFSAWSIWFCVSVFLVATLSCAVACCLQCWLKRRRLFPSTPRTLTVFALSDAVSVYESDAALWTLPKIHPHLQNPDWGSSDSSFNVMVGSGPPPSYGEVMKQESCPASRPTRGVASDLHQ